MEAWANQWELTDVGRTRHGGQGTVSQVKEKVSGRSGALKQLHPDHQKSKERRIRMRNEVDALRVLEGDGVPIVLDSNVDDWENTTIPLYVVFEWIDGPTLGEYINKRLLGLDQALVVLRHLMKIIDNSHRLQILHRDLKPDNVIIRGDNLEDPVVVDFGMSWTATREEEANFKTGKGQEIGNRFLRLPEYAPGNHAGDERSDISMLIALLLYMLTGQAPRVLEDTAGNMPHHPDRIGIPVGILDDARGPRLKRVFDMGFQTRIDLRIQSISQLDSLLGELEPREVVDNGIASELERLEEVVSTDIGRMIADCLPYLEDANKRFLSDFQRLARENGFGCGGGGPNAKDGGRKVDLKFFIQRGGLSTPNVSFLHYVELRDNYFVAVYRVEGNSEVTYYEGVISNPDELIERAVEIVPEVFRQCIEAYTDKLEKIMRS